MAFASQLPISFLNVKHPCYSYDDLCLADAMYRGGRAFNKIKASLIRRRSADADQAYLNAHLSAAAYFNYAGGIFDGFLTTMFQSPPVITFSLKDGTGDPSMLDYYNNVLTDGLSDVLQGRAKDLMLHGYGLLTLSYPEPGDYPSLGAQKKAGALDARLAYLSPMVVENWYCDPMGRLQWLKTHTTEDISSIPFGEYDQRRHAWTYLTQDAKVTYEAIEDLKKPWQDESKEMATKVSEASNRLGLPVFECCSADRASLFDRIADPALDLWCRETGLNFVLDAQCFGQPWAAVEDMKKLGQKTNEFALWDLGKDGKVGYLVPEGVVFDAQEKNAERKQTNLLASINAEALRLSNRDQHAASGDAKEIDREPVESMLAYFAGKVLRMLDDAVKYGISSRREEDVVAYKISGLDCFSPVATSTKLDNVTKFVQLPGSKTAKEIALANISQTMAVGATPEERARIDSEKEIDEEQLALAAAGQTGNQPQAASSATSNGTSSGADSGASSAASSGNAKADAGPPIRIKTSLKKLDPKRIDPSHDTDPEARQDIADSIKKDGYDEKYPVLVVRMPGMHAKGGDVFKSLDGHHRAGASRQLGLKSIPAYVLDYDDFAKAQALAGVDATQDLSALDKMIELPDGRTYDQVRTENDHTNGKSGAASSAASSGTKS